MRHEEAVFSRRRSRGAAVVFGCVLAAALLWGAELVLVWLHPDPFHLAIEQARAAGRPVDPRPRSEVVAELRRAGVAAVPRVVPATLLVPGPNGKLHSRLGAGTSEGELLPVSGIGSRPTVLCAEAGPFAVFTSDSHGLRNPPDVWSLEPIELALVGDSFTLGECVADGQTIADPLRRRWPATVNLGYTGHSPLLELASLIEYGPALRPRTTLWLYFENDLSWFDLGRSENSPLLMRYLEPGFSQHLLERRPEIDARLQQLLDGGFERTDELRPAEHSRSAQGSSLAEIRSIAELKWLRRLLGQLRPRPRADVDDDQIELFGAILARARAVTSEWGGELVVAYLPGVWNFDRFAGIPGWTGPQVREAIREKAHSLGLAFIDVERAIADHPDPLSLYAYPGQSELVGAPHMNGAGYAFAADTLAAGLGARRTAARSPSAAPTDSTRRSQISRQ